MTNLLGEALMLFPLSFLFLAGLYWLLAFGTCVVFAATGYSISEVVFDEWMRRATGLLITLGAMTALYLVTGLWCVQDDLRALRLRFDDEELERLRSRK